MSSNPPFTTASNVWPHSSGAVAARVKSAHPSVEPTVKSVAPTARRAPDSGIPSTPPPVTSLRRRNSPVSSHLNPRSAVLTSEPRDASPWSTSVDSDDDTHSLRVVLEPDPDPEAVTLYSFCHTAHSMAHIPAWLSLVTTDAASTVTDGQTPLHAVSTNAAWARAHWTAWKSNSTHASSADSARTTEYGNDTHVADMVWHLWSAYPPAMMTTCRQHGCLPFEHWVREWVEDRRRSEPDTTWGRRSGPQPAAAVPPHGSVWPPTRWRLASAPWGYAVHNNSQPSLQTATAVASPRGDVERGATPDAALPLDGPPGVTAEVLYSIHMLSMLLDRMDPRVGRDNGAVRHVSPRPPTRSFCPSLQDQLHTSSRHDLSASIVQSIASIPNLVPTILLLDDADQQLVWDTTLMRRVVTSTHSIGSWLTELMQSPHRRASDVALAYLHLVSSDATAGCGDPRGARHPHALRVSHPPTESAWDDVYHTVSRLHDFVPSLLSLSERQIEEAATTKIVQQVLDRVISRPFAVMVIFCDALFLALLIYGYRHAVNGVLLGRARRTILWHVWVANTGTFYFVLREIGKAVSLCMIPRRRRVRVYWTVWSVIDLVTTVLALSSTVVVRAPHGSVGVRSLCAITTGFMWLRVLSYLKGINMQLATFVLAILQIAKDLLWFMVILCIVVVLFSQMLFTLLAPEECSVDAALRESQDCSQSEYYLKVYAIFLGDFGLFERKSFVSIFSLVLAVLYTFCASVVLLNVLIAIASDSYEKCLIRSANLFGRARVLMLAELVFFQNLLRRRESTVPSTPCPTESSTLTTRWIRSKGGSVVFFTLSLLSIISWTIGDFVGSYVLGEGYGNAWMSFGSLLVNATILSGIILCLSASASDGNEDIESRPFTEWYGQYFQSLTLRLLGSSGTKAKSRGAEQQWQGRLLFLQDKMSSIAVDTKAECGARIQSLESAIKRSESSIQSELAAMELRWNTRQEANDHLADMIRQLLDQHSATQDSSVKE